MTKEGIWIIALMICMIIQEARMIKLWNRIRKFELKTIELHGQMLKVLDEVYSNFDKLEEAINSLAEGSENESG